MRKFIILVLGFCCLSSSAKKKKDIELENKILEVIQANPEVLIKSIESYSRKEKQRLEEEAFQKALKNKVKVEIGNSPVIGNVNAKHQVFVFSDYQCPYCQLADSVTEDLLKKYGNDIAIIPKNYPLPFHPQAKPAAQAAWAAHKQGKFNEFHKSLFAFQDRLSGSLYLELAEKLGLNIEQFKKDLSSEESEKFLAEEMKQASDLGIGGTPFFIVDGVKVEGLRSIEDLTEIIDYKQ